MAGPGRGGGLGGRGASAGGLTAPPTAPLAERAALLTSVPARWTSVPTFRDRPVHQPPYATAATAAAAARASQGIRQTRRDRPTPERSASASAFMERWRSAGLFSRHYITATAMDAGMRSRRGVLAGSGGAGSFRIFCTRSTKLPALKGTVPESSS